MISSKHIHIGRVTLKGPRRLYLYQYMHTYTYVTTTITEIMNFRVSGGTGGVEGERMRQK